ncbi:MAG: CoA pyrophosphatase [Desulfosalsimonadaceae bacterium]
MKTEHLKNVLCRHEMPKSPSVRIFEPASVLMLLYEKDGEACLLAVRKADTEGYPWRNQVALPGGRVDGSDDSPLAAAYREVKEELDIDASEIEMVGSLGYFQTIRQTEIETFVGFWKGDGASLRFDPREISATLEIPLDDLIKTHVESNYMGRRPDIATLLYPAGTNSGKLSDCGDIVVWGVTAVMLHFFLEHLRTVSPESFDGILKKQSFL